MALTEKYTRVSIDVFGEREIARDILRKGGRMTDPAPAFAKISIMLTTRTARHWKSNGARSGKPWKPLADSTVAAKARNKKARFEPEAILRLTGALWRSLTKRRDKNAIRTANSKELHWGSRVDYGKYHHSRKPRKSNLPRRAVVDFLEKDKKDVLKVLQRWIITGAV